MTLQLDERRIAILAELGIRHVPLTAVAAEPAPEPVELPVAVEVARPVPARLPRRELDTMQWDALAAAVGECRACPLCDGRKNAVFGVGDAQADWLIVGEPPGEEEDRQGAPFVGAEGRLLDNMLRAMGLGRSQNVYITNVLRCRPAVNRNPGADELAQCEPFLRRQVQLLQPKVILAMGRFAVQALLGTTEPMGKLRGQRHQYMGVPVVVTFHPVNLLRNPAEKAKAWADLCLAMEVARAQPA